MTTSLTHHSIRFLASCILGISLWFILRMHYDHTLSITIPVHVQELYASHIIVQEALNITVSGPWKKLCDFIHRKPTVTLTTGTYSRGLQELTITNEQLNLPPELRLASRPTILLFVNPSR